MRDNIFGAFPTLIANRDKIKFLSFRYVAMKIAGFEDFCQKQFTFDKVAPGGCRGRQ